MTIHPAENSMPPPRWRGTVEGAHQGLVYGWAVDTQCMDARVILEVCLDGEALEHVAADVARNDLMDTFAGLFPGVRRPDCCHGFVADIGVAAMQAVGHLSVRVANSEHVLPGRWSAAQAGAAIERMARFVYGDGGLRIHGCVVVASESTAPVQLRAFVGHQLVAVAVADRLDPRASHHEGNVMGFTLNLPLECADGRVHSVRVVDQQGNPLPGSPVQVCAYATGGRALMGRADNPAQDLLRSVIESYEQYLPRSVGWGCYPQWAQVFEPAVDAALEQKPVSAKSRSVTKMMVGMVIVGNGDDTQVARTETSLRALTEATVRIYGPVDGTAGQPMLRECLAQALRAQCDVVACVRAGDTLTVHAMRHALAGFDSAQANVVYTDSEHDAKPWFKPAWNPEYALASDYPLDFMLMRADAVRTLIDANTDLHHAADLCWQILAQVWNQGQQAIVHVPRVLYHQHTPLQAGDMQARLQAARQALARVEPNTVLELLPEQPGNAAFLPRRLHRSVVQQERNTRVSLIIPTRDRVELLQRCIASLEQFTEAENLEIIVVDNDSVQPKTHTYLRQLVRKGIRILPFPGVFNFSAMNNRAVAAASGEVVGLINNDIEALHHGWLTEMLSHLLSPGVGAVGAKLLWPNGMVQHGGVQLGQGFAAGHFGNLLMDADWGEHGRNQLVQQVSGVTAACMLLRKKDYVAVGGLDEHAFPVAFNDVDLCLKLRCRGMAIVWTPHARLLHAESASRGHEDTPQKKARAQRELQELRRRWSDALLHDPAYHPSLSLDSHSQAFGGLALPPRDRSPRYGTLRQTRPT